ncbi:MAG: hypothetical protein IPN11_11200 [Opitutaceae bacterium]|nr:hypothetical protein [Opitutaceae bacterium]
MASSPTPDIASNSRRRFERCAATLRCEPADRAPAYIPAIACDVSSAILGRTAYTGTGSVRYAEVAAWARGAAAHAEFEAQLIEDLVEIHRVLDVDVLRMPWRMNERPDAQLDQFTFRFGPESGEHTIWQYTPATADFSPVYESPRVDAPEVRLRKRLVHLEKIAADPMPLARASLAPALDLWRRFGEEFYVCSAGAGIGVGYDPDDLELMITEPDLLRQQCLLQAEYAIAVGKALLETKLPLVMAGGGDLAGTQGPIYSPAMFRAMVLPGYVKALEALNQLGVHYYFRSDGNLWSLMDMLFTEAACPGFGETDRDATMTVAAVRARFPRMVIWGNMSSSLLLDGTAAEVRAQAQATIAEAGGRGYFQGCSNAIVHGTPVANVRAMFEVR